MTKTYHKPAEGAPLCCSLRATSSKTRKAGEGRPRVRILTVPDLARRRAPFWSPRGRLRQDRQEDTHLTGQDVLYD